MSCGECDALASWSCPRLAVSSAANHQVLVLRHAAPADCYRGGKHHFDHARSNEPVQPERGSFRQRMRKEVKPGKASGEQQDRGQKTADGGPRKTPCSALKNKSSRSRDQRVDHQVPSRRSEDLSDAAGTCGTEHRQACCALHQVECKRREAAFTPER